VLSFQLQNSLLVASEEAKLRKSDFWSTDSQDLFVKNVSTRPANWHWYIIGTVLDIELKK